jgi:hypothetical protein
MAQVRTAQLCVSFLRCPDCVPAGGSTSAKCSGECSAGRYVNAPEGADLCKFCALGKFQSAKGKASCTLCPKGKYDPVHGVHSARPFCEACGYGEVAAAGSSSCEIAYVSQYEQKLSKQCKTGKYRDKRTVSHKLVCSF